MDSVEVVTLPPDLRATPVPAGLRDLWASDRRWLAVLFDLDGTLYSQTPVRLLMAAELMSLPLKGLREGSRQWRAVTAYRRAQEQLRRTGLPVEPGTQLTLAASNAGLSIAEAEQAIDEWMFRRPLKYLARWRAPGLLPLLDFLDRQGIRLGVLSDYPAAAKLGALELSDRFSLVLSAVDVGAFKPSPLGYLEACKRWQLRPEQVLMVGDRVEVDAAGAQAAGMSSVIISKQRNRPLPSHCLFLPSMERLHRVLIDRA